MKLIDPKVEVEKYDGLKIMKNIERAMRTCYKSEGQMTEDSYKRLLGMAVSSGHESVMEHEKISVRLITDVGAYKDLTRHRTGVAFSIESTRWCNYARDKFDNNIKFMKPVFYVDSWQDKSYEGSAMSDEEYKSYLWYDCMEDIEQKYLTMAKAGAKPDELRMLLPHSTAAELVMTCNIREWRHILSLRTQKNVHPSIRQVLIPLLIRFQEDMPELFGMIEYDKEFPKELYAEITTMEEII